MASETGKRYATRFIVQNKLALAKQQPAVVPTPTQPPTVPIPPTHLPAPPASNPQHIQLLIGNPQAKLNEIMTKYSTGSGAATSRQATTERAVSIQDLARKMHKGSDFKIM